MVCGGRQNNPFEFRTGYTEAIHPLYGGFPGAVTLSVYPVVVLKGAYPCY